MLNYIQNHQNHQYKIIPLNEYQTWQLYNEKLKHVISPPILKILAFANKNSFNEYVVKHNLVQFTPKVYSNVNEIPKGTMCIIKPYLNSNGYNMRITDIVTPEDFEKTIIQEYIPKTKEYSSNIVVKNGKIILCFTYETAFESSTVIKSYPHNLGISAKVEIRREYLDIMEKFLVEYTGVCNIDYTFDESKNIKIFEINPRLGGTLIRNNNEELHLTLNTLLTLN